jgi:Alpha/beta hydrolase family
MSSTTNTDVTTTVVLVHGAFVDASSWSGVIAGLEAAGVDVLAPPNLLRGIATDAAYLTAFVEALGRPTLLVGHSYGGAMITQAGTDAKNALGLNTDPDALGYFPGASGLPVCTATVQFPQYCWYGLNPTLFDGPSRSTTTMTSTGRRTASWQPPR